MIFSCWVGRVICRLVTTKTSTAAGQGGWSRERLDALKDVWYDAARRARCFGSLGAETVACLVCCESDMGDVTAGHLEGLFQGVGS